MTTVIHFRIATEVRFVKEGAAKRASLRKITKDNITIRNVLQPPLRTTLEEENDAELTSATRSRYIEGWQRARKEQHIQTITNKEIGPTQTIEDLKKKADQEQRVHVEIELLTNIKINELIIEVEQWMSKYDKDMERIDLKIQLKKNDYENMHDKRIELEETIEKHAELIKNWVMFKEDREAARQYREKMTNSAIIVQAWWRGLLVRQQLGPYRVVKKKGKAKEEKSGKNKK
ncbi:unnamed protein product [Euphydryas editha]|uniref:Dynein regulatory complex protein 9 n=1 Tax=Euphydryas editha TaxID=104508 RepID=A0AAU9U8P0_EUPED|nr:unnamed protein product [Euphydryas editha]